MQLQSLQNLFSGMVMTLSFSIRSSFRLLVLALLCLAAACCLGCNGAKDPVSLSPAPVGGGKGGPSRVSGPLAYGDKLTIKVWRHEDLGQELLVDETGRFDFPLIGSVEAAGKTLDDVRNEMRTRLAVYVVDPQISLTLMESSYRSAFVYGEVNSEGPVTLDHDVTLWEAIAKSGGFTDDASQDNVLVIRGAQGKGEMQLMLANMKLSSVSKDKPFNFSGYLMAGDLVFVPPTTLAEVENFMSRLRNILEAIASAQRAIIFMPQVRDAILDIYYGEPPDYSSNSGGQTSVAGENLSNQGGTVTTPTQ